MQKYLRTEEIDARESSAVTLPTLSKELRLKLRHEAHRLEAIPFVVTDQIFESVQSMLSLCRNHETPYTAMLENLREFALQGEKESYQGVLREMNKGLSDH